MDADQDVKEPQKDRSGVKRPKSMDAVLKDSKKPKMKVKVTEAVKSLVNVLRIKDKRKSSTDAPGIGTFIQDSISNNTVSILSSFLARNPFENLLCGGTNRDSLSQSWSYFGNDPLKELSKYEDCPSNEENQDNADIFIGEGYLEDDYWHDYHENLDEDMASAERTSIHSGIKMGVSVLQSLNTARFNEPKATCKSLRRNKILRKSSRQRHTSLPNFTDYKGLSLPTLKERNIIDNGHAENTSKCNQFRSSYSIYPVLTLNGALDEINIYSESFVRENPLPLFPKEVMTETELMESKFQLENKALRSVNKLNVSQSKVCTQSPIAADLSSHCHEYINEQHYLTKCDHAFIRSKFESVKDVPHIRYFSDSQNSDMAELRNRGSSDEAVVPNFTIKSQLDCSKLDAALLEKNWKSSNTRQQESPSYQNKAAAKKYFQKTQISESGFNNSCKFSATVIPSKSTPQACLSSIKTESSSPLPYSENLKKSSSALPILDDGRWLEDQIKHHISSSKAAQNSHSPKLMLQSIDSPYELNAVPQFKETMPLEIPSLSLAISSSFVNSKRVTELTCQQTPTSLDLSHNLAEDSEILQENLDSQKQTTYQANFTTPKSKSQRPAKYSSYASNGNIGHNLVNIMVSPALPGLDANGNYATLAQQSQSLSPQAKQELTPANKILTPLTTSSPMHIRQMPSSSSRDVLLSLQDFVSPVKRNPEASKSKYIRENLSLKRTQRRSIHLRHRLTLCDINSNLHTSSDEEQEVISPASTDYLILKKAADAIVNRITYKKEIKSFLNMAGLVEYLRDHYQNEIFQMSSRSVRSLSDYRILKIQSSNTFEPHRLTHGNCLSELRTSILVNQPLIVETCASFIFENLHFLISCPEFLQIPPELFLMLLNNDNSVVLGHNGFPLSCKESEREVQRAMKKYLQNHKAVKLTKHSLLDKMFSSINNPNAAFKQKNDVTKVNVIPLSKRPYCEINYQESEKLVTMIDTQLGYLFQPYLSSSSYLTTDSGQSAQLVTSHENCIWNYCNTTHTLRKMFFSYGCHNKVPYITQIRLQYAVHGRKVVYFIGGADDGQGPTPERKSTSNNIKPITNLSPSAASGKDRNIEDGSIMPQLTEESIFKKTVIKLACGEHVTGVMVQGNSVLHNVMIRTNKGRHVRAHGIMELPCGTVWTCIPPPQDSKYCLQAICANTRTTSTRTYLRDVSAVWAVLLVPLNNLN